MGSPSLLQGIFPTEEFPTLQADSLLSEPPGRPQTVPCLPFSPVTTQSRPITQSPSGPAEPTGQVLEAAQGQAWPQRMDEHQVACAVSTV